MPISHAIQPQLILHIGAPKCGSSSLQTALTKMPDMTGEGERRYRYVSTLVQGGAAARLPFTLTPVYGAALTRIGVFSAYGYTCCPDVVDAGMAEKFTNTVRMAYTNGIRQKHIPILSNEGWIQRHAAFAGILKSLGNPPVDVVAFLRPPVEWLNASFWQWGVWGTPNLNVWMHRSAMTYSFGMDLKAWSEIPNVRLKVYPSKPDIVAHFAGLFGLPLVSGKDSNRSSPPALIGFLLRNRRFRPSAHQPATEFVFQRWCPKLTTRQPWAVGSAQVLGYRPIVRQNIDVLREILTEEDCQRLFAEPRWLAEKPYHEELLGGLTPLDDLADLPGLWESLQQGILNAGGRPAARTNLPSTASLSDWDAVLAVAMDQLISCDKRVRHHGLSAAQGRSIFSRFSNFIKGKDWA